ncbi:MAG: hypothetical protein OXG35_13100 [Acidobacteria bacterium]|nr:hypothetical protein [Acidobacteriota bacterium]
MVASWIWMPIPASSRMRLPTVPVQVVVPCQFRGFRWSRAASGVRRFEMPWKGWWRGAPL